MTVRNAKQVKELKQRIMIMRKIFFLLLTLLGQICLAQGVVVPKSGAALDKETGSSFCPLDSIPDWVKEKTTQKEYELWKKASRYYQVDYSVLQRASARTIQTTARRVITDSMGTIHFDGLPCFLHIFFYDLHAVFSFVVHTPHNHFHLGFGIVL